MLDWIRSAPILQSLLKRLGRGAVPAPDAGAEARAFLAARPGPMTPLRSAAPANDDVLSPICGEVERELRRAGHLR